MGEIVLAYDGFERIDAQIDARAACEFSWSNLHRIFKWQVGPSSTVTGLQTQDRYPSPLKRSAHAGRPLFFDAVMHRRLSADGTPARRAEFRPIRRFQFFLNPFCEIGCLVSKSNQGDIPCVRHSLVQPLSPPPSSCRPAKATLNVALWARVLVPLLPLRQEATHSPVLSLVVRQACSATTQASASSNQTTNNQTNRAGVRRCAPRPFLMQDPQLMAGQEGT